MALRTEKLKHLEELVQDAARRLKKLVDENERLRKELLRLEEENGRMELDLKRLKAVGERQHEARQPRVDHVRPVHRRHHERNREERPDAHHADDVGGRRLEQAHRAIERGSRRSGLRPGG